MEGDGGKANKTPEASATEGKNGPQRINKLELAKAFEEMGDSGGARQVLDEILSQGDEVEKEAARAYLDERQSMSDQLPPEFRKQLAEAHMRFTLPHGFTFIDPRPNDRVRYTGAIAPREDKFEIRYHIVSLKPQPLPAGYTSVASADLNTLHGAHLFALMNNVGREVISKPSQFPAAAVSAEFGANWGVTCRLALEPSTFSQGFSECVLMALHRRDVADAYVFFMFEDFARVQHLMESNFYILRFIGEARAP
jgi:FimV-like protein